MNLRVYRLLMAEGLTDWKDTMLEERLQHIGANVYHVQNTVAKLIDAVAEKKPHMVLLNDKMRDEDLLHVVEICAEADESEPKPLFYVMGNRFDRYTVQRLEEKGAQCHYFPALESQVLVKRIQNDLNDVYPYLQMAMSCERLIMNSIRTALYQFPIHASLKGYHYLLTAIFHVMVYPDRISSTTKVLYPKVGEVYQDDGKCVERCIRTAIRNCWNNVDPKVVNKYFGESFAASGKYPTSRQFIAAVAHYLIHTVDLSNPNTATRVL